MCNTQWVSRLRQAPLAGVRVVKEPDRSGVHVLPAAFSSTLTRTTIGLYRVETLCETDDVQGHRGYRRGQCSGPNGTGLASSVARTRW